MTSLIKVCGLTAAVALLAGALGVSGAQGADAVLTVEGGGSATVEGQQLGVGIYTRGARTITCEVIRSQDTASNGETTFSAGTPVVEQCHSNLGGPATLRTNGCEFLFHLSADADEPEDTWTATADFICPPGKKAEAVIYLNHEAHTKESPACIYEYLTQEGLDIVDLSNEVASGETPKDWIRAQINIEGIVSKRIAGSALLCGPENHSTGSIIGEGQLKGESEGTPRGITISTGE